MGGRDLNRGTETGMEMEMMETVKTGRKPKTEARPPGLAARARPADGPRHLFSGLNEISASYTGWIKEKEVKRGAGPRRFGASSSWSARKRASTGVCAGLEALRKSDDKE